MDQPVVVEKIYDASTAQTWKALTDKDAMKKWYFDLSDFKPETGFKFKFAGGSDPAKPYMHLCEITEVIPAKKLAYSWRYEGYPGISFVTFELFPRENMTLLKVTHKGIETFPKDNPDFSRSSFEEGWKAILNTSLENYLKTTEK